MAGTSVFPVGGFDSLSISHAAGQTILSADINTLADAVNKSERLLGLLGARPVIDLVKNPVYAVSTTNSAAANTTAIQAAFTAAASTGAAVYLRGAGDPYPVNTLTLPSAPITFCGDGPTASTLYTTSATILTYDPTSPITRGVSSPYSSQQTNAGQHFTTNCWTVRDLGFTGKADWSNPAGSGWYFPKWNFGGAFTVYDCLTMYAENVTVSTFVSSGSNAFGPNGGIFYIISGLANDSHFVNCVVDNCYGNGWVIGGDSRMLNCEAANNGATGFYCDSYIWQASNLKSYDNGTQNPGTAGSTNSGIYIHGTPAGVAIVGAYCQDNFGAGLYIENAQRVRCTNITADRNNWTAGNDGVVLKDSTDCTLDINGTDSKNAGALTSVTGVNALNSATVNVGSTTGFGSSGAMYLFDATNQNVTRVTYTGVTATSFTGCSGHPATVGSEIVSQFSIQQHTLRVVNTGGNTNARNEVRVQHSQFYVGAANNPAVVREAINSASDLRGTNVQVGASGGGQITLTPASGVIHPDPYQSQDQIVPMTGNVTSVGTAYNIHQGCRMRITFMPTSGGNWTVTGWNVSYKGTTAIPITGGTTGMYMVTEWEAIHPASGGTAWYLQNTPAWRT